MEHEAFLNFMRFITYYMIYLSACGLVFKLIVWMSD